MEHREIVTCHFSTIRSQSMHFHQAVEIVYLLDGILELRYESEQHVLRPNEFLLINSNVRHEYQGKGDVLLASLRIDYRQLTDLFHGEQLYFLCDSAKAEEASAGYAKLRRCVWQIFQYEQSREGQANAYRNSLYYQMIYILSSEFLVKKELQGHDFRRGNQSERMKEIFDFLTMNYREQISLQKLADQLFLSPTYLSRYIKKNLNMSFLKLLQNIRLEYAVEELVCSDKTVLKIAMDNGFSGITGFNRSFQESYGMSPTEYRQKQQESSRKAPSMELTEEMQKKIDDFLLANGAVEAETSDQDVSILEADCRERETLAKNWNQVLNIGKAQDLLRYDVCGQVRFLQKSLRFQYGRVWNVLSDEMMIRLTSKRNICILMNTASIISLIAIFLFGAKIPAVIFIFSAVIGYSNSTAGVGIGMVCDCIEYGDWKYGIRDEALPFAVTSFSVKLATAITGSVGVLLLAAAGYVAGAEQSEAVKMGINAVVNLIPAACFVVSTIPLFFYKLDDKMMRQIASDLDERKMAGK